MPNDDISTRNKTQRSLLDINVNNNMGDKYNSKYEISVKSNTSGITRQEPHIY